MSMRRLRTLLPVLGLLRRVARHGRRAGTGGADLRARRRGQRDRRRRRRRAVGVAARRPGADRADHDVGHGRVRRRGRVRRVPGQPAAVGADEAIAAPSWFTLSDGSLARLRPGASVATFSLKAGRPTSLASGADGALWMTVDGPDAVTRFTAEPLDEVTYPTGADPRSLVAAPDGALWFVEGSRLGRITPAGALTYRPVAGASPDALAADAAGAIWYAQGAVVHRLDDATDLRGRRPCRGPRRGAGRRAVGGDGRRRHADRPG